jgi:hypothetical protein
MNVYNSTPEVSDVTLLMKPLMYCRLNLSLRPWKSYSPDGQGNNKQKVPKFEVKFVGGPRYDLSNLPKTKSGNRRRSFRRRKIPQQLEGIGLLLEYHSLTL